MQNGKEKAEKKERRKAKESQRHNVEMESKRHAAACEQHFL